MSSMHLKRYVVDVLLYALYGAFVGWSFMSQAIYGPIHSCHVKHPHGIIVFGPPSGLPVTAANAAFWHGAVPSWQVLSTPIETRSARFSCNAFKTSTQRGRAISPSHCMCVCVSRIHCHRFIMKHNDAELFRMMPKQTRIQPYRLPRVTLMSYRSENPTTLTLYGPMTQYDLVWLMAFIYMNLAS